MLQGALLLFGNLLVDESELEIAVNEEESDETDDQDWQKPTAAPEGGIEVEHLAEGVGIELHQQRPEEQHIEHHGGEEPQDVAIDECAEEQIDLTVEHDEQLTTHKLYQYWPEACSCYKDDDRVGQEHGEPQEVIAAEVGRDEETLDGRITRDRLQDIGFHHHTRRGLEDEAQQIVDDEDEGHHRYHHTCIAIGSHRDDDTIYNKVKGEECPYEVEKCLCPFTLFKQRTAPCAQTIVPAQELI